MLFANQKKHAISIPATKDREQSAERVPADVAFLIHFLCENLLRDPRMELFVLDGSV